MNTKTKNEQLVSTLSNISEVVEGRSPWADARRRFMKNKAAVASLVILILIASDHHHRAAPAATHPRRYRLECIEPGADHGKRSLPGYR